MSLSFQDLQEALTLDDRDEFIIWQNSSKRNKRVKRGNLFASKGVTVRGKFIDSESGNDVGLAAATALTNAATALATAEGAQTSADGKTKVYYQSAEPTGGTYNAGDLWYDTDDNYKIYVRSGGAWVASFSPFPGIDASGNVTGLVKATGTESTFALLANKFQIIDPANPATKTEANVPFEIVDGNVRIKNAQIQTVDAGKLTAGFIGAQVIAVNGTSATGTAGAGGYIESTTFVPTWVSGAYTVRAYTTSGTSGAFLGKSIPSDVVQVKTIEPDGSYKLYRSKVNQGASASIGPPNATYWDEIDPIPTFNVTIGNETKTIQNLGFRIVSNGYSEFGGALFRGAVIANEGFFGNTVNAVRLDSKGLTVGNNGYLKSRGVGYNGTSFFATSGTSGGFFLGNTLAEGDPDDLYQLFVGKPTGNNLWWNGNDLFINGKTLSLGGASLGSNNYGITINSAWGIRRGDLDGVLTISAGNNNGIQYGAQIDMAGAELDTSATDDGNGILILSAAYNASNNFNGPRDGAIEFRTSKSRTETKTVGAESISVDVGLTRMLISMEGAVVVGRNPSEAINGPDGNDGELFVLKQIVVGGDDFWASSGSHGKLYLKQNDNTTSIFLNGETGDVEAITYTSTSSKKFKKKIKNLKNGLDLVGSLRPVTFDWKNNKKQNDIGLIAEEVDQILPSVVGKNDKGEVSGVDYGRLTTILIQAVKELALEVNKLKNKIK